MATTFGVLRGAVAAAVMLAGGVAAGQVTPVEAYWVVVSGDNASLLSGDKDIMYPVAKAKAGQMLRVDGESKDGWARVTYPPGTGAFVPADAVQIDTGSRTATLTRPSQLKAANLTTGLSGSWKPVFDQALTAGTKLVILDVTVVDDGRTKAYRVAPPEGARAYIRTAMLRKATPTEVEQAGGAGKTAEPKPAVPAPTGETPLPPTPQDSGVSLVDPMVTTGPGVQPAGVQGADGKAAPTAAAPKPREDRQIATIKQLEAAFNDVRKQPELDAELTELVAEYQRTIDSLGTSPADAGLKARLQHRLEILKLSADIQAEKRKAEAERAALSDESARLAEQLTALEKSRQYAIVGRLSASMIYDGQRMPLMYRVTAVGGQAGSRTLAYVKPDERQAIAAKLGQVVGIVGDATMDRALNLNVITPSRIDVLEASELTGTPGAAQATPGGN